MSPSEEPYLFAHSQPTTEGGAHGTCSINVYSVDDVGDLITLAVAQGTHVLLGGGYSLGETLEIVKGAATRGIEAGVKRQ